MNISFMLYQEQRLWPKRIEDKNYIAGRRFTPVGEGGSGRRPLPPKSLNILVGLTFKLLSLYCIVGLA